MAVGADVSYGRVVNAHEREIVAGQPRNGEQGFLPDHIAERREEFRRTTPGQRVAETIAISRTVTKIAAATAHRRER